MAAKKKTVPTGPACEVEMLDPEECERIELEKRLQAAAIIRSACPKCGNVVEKNLTEQDRYLASPIIGEPHDVPMWCCEDDGGCGHEWEVQVVVKVVIEAVAVRKPRKPRRRR